jgi:hypothetical protein
VIFRLELNRIILILLVNGNHLAADSTFIEKRRRGLSRFANALVRHPVLSQEQLVIMFLTVPTVSFHCVSVLDALWLSLG